MVKKGDKKKSYDWKITFLKGLKMSCEVFLSGLLVMQFSNPWFLAIVPVIEMVLNWFKHK